jgi:hypothetical protein
VIGRGLTSGKLARSPNNINFGNAALGATAIRCQKLTESRDLQHHSAASECFLGAIFACSSP